MRFQRPVLALLAIAIPASAAHYSLDLTPENTKIQWTLADVLHTVRGTFNLKRGKIDLDSELGTASGRVVVDVASGNSGSEARDRRMHANVLESTKYPEAVFTPERFEGNFTVPGTSNLKVHGTFLIHGGSHQMTMVVIASATTDRVTSTITFEIPFVAWGMKDPSNFLLKVNKTVQLSIQSDAVLTKQ
jgi:polyisoprenoid-binding protein YceI